MQAIHPESFASCETRSGNEVGLFYSSNKLEQSPHGAPKILNGLHEVDVHVLLLSDTTGCSQGSASATPASNLISASILYYTTAAFVHPSATNDIVQQNLTTELYM